MAKNRKGAQRRRKIGRIAGLVVAGRIAGPAGIAAVAIARKLINKNKKKLQKFVVNEGGVVPSENPEELAVQFAQVRSKKIKEIQEDPTIEAETTEEAAEVFEEQQADDLENESYTGESDAFTEEAIGAVLGIAKGAVNKIKEKRLAKGKKFMGKTKAQWDAKKGIEASTDGSGNVSISGLSNPLSKDPLSGAIRDAQAGTMDTMVKKYLPFVVIGIVALVIVFAMKKK
jgi:hypothetical protein